MNEPLVIAATQPEDQPTETPLTKRGPAIVSGREITGAEASTIVNNNAALLLDLRCESEEPEFAAHLSTLSRLGA